MTEAEIRAAIRKAAREEYGLLVFDTSQARSQGKHLAGLPDLLVWGHDRFLTLEVKQPGGQLKDSQMDFIENVMAYTGENVRHQVVYSVEQAREWLAWAAREGEYEEDMGSGCG